MHNGKNANTTNNNIIINSIIQYFWTVKNLTIGNRCYLRISRKLKQFDVGTRRT